MKRILITPLNWGLGHATRCIPIINELLHQGCEVIIGTDGRALHLLKAEYPSLTILELPAYNISYRTNNMIANIAPQILKVLKVIQKEHQIIQKIVKEYQIDAIISDNRYGCYSKNVYSIFLTHQLNIKIPNQTIENGVAFFNKKLIKRFDACWIPDYEKEEESLAGILSRNNGLKNIQYIGTLTRMVYSQTKIKRDILVILSGPEPQRTYFEEKVIKQLKELPLKSLIIKGKTETHKKYRVNTNVMIQNFMTAPQLNQAILESKFIITRSGYSTIMDLAVLGTKALFIPTPGQTEQEYLAKYFNKKNIYLTQSQKELDVAKALKTVPNYLGIKTKENTILPKVIAQFLIHISKK